MSDQTIQFQVLAAVADLLGASNCRLRTFAPTELPAINVIPGDEVTQMEDVQDDENVFQFHVRFIVVGIDDASSKADSLFLQKVRLLAANPTLGGLVRELRRTGRKWEMEQESQQQIALVATYECQFTTRRNDPAVAGY